MQILFHLVAWFGEYCDDCSLLWRVISLWHAWMNTLVTCLGWNILMSFPWWQRSWKPEDQYDSGSTLRMNKFLIMNSTCASNKSSSGSLTRICIPEWHSLHRRPPPIEACMEDWTKAYMKFSIFMHCSPIVSYAQHKRKAHVIQAPWCSCKTIMLWFSCTYNGVKLAARASLMLSSLIFFSMAVRNLFHTREQLEVRSHHQGSLTVLCHWFLLTGHPEPNIFIIWLPSPLTPEETSSVSTWLTPHPIDDILSVRDDQTRFTAWDE